MAIEKLSNAACSAAKPREDGKALILSDGGGLRLVVKPHGVKEWQVRYSMAGKESALSVGIYPKTGLALARDNARAIRDLVASGIHPLKQRNLDALNVATEQDTTFKRVALDLIKNKIDGIGTKSGLPISESYRKKIEGILEANLYPVLGNLPIQSITPPILKAVLAPISERSALDLLAVCRRIAQEVFDLAKSDARFIGDNPAACLQFRKHQGENRKSLPWAAMNGFMHRLDAGRLSPATVTCIRLMMLTATRPGETLGAQWCEFDLDAALWTIPAVRMKMRKAHIVPLSRQAVEAVLSLRVLTGHTPYLFPSQRGSKAKTLSGMGLLKAVRTIAGHDQVHAHGFRATFRTHAEESGLWTFDAMECALAHGKKNSVVAAYARSTHLEERKKMAQWYSDQLDQAQHGAMVIQMKTA